MKSEIRKKLKDGYPYLGINKDTGLIVLFNTTNVGTVVKSDESKYTIGMYDNEWDETNFMAFTGIVELSN